MKKAKPAGSNRKSSRKPAQKPGLRSMPKAISSAYTKRASIFRNGSNQAVRLPQELRFAASVKEVRIRKQGDSLLLSPVKPDWASFFAMQVSVPEDFLADRGDTLPQSRTAL